MSSLPTEAARSRFEAAFAAHRAGRLEEAAQGYRATLELAPGHREALHLLGLAQHQRGAHRDALDWFERALSDAPPTAALAPATRAGVLLNRGHTYKALGERDAAAASYRAALALQPGFAPAHFSLANLLADWGRPNDAIAAYREAIRLDPKQSAYHNNLGNALAASGQHEAAIDAFETVLRLAPDAAGAHNNLGISAAALGRTDAAIAHYRDALRIAPRFTQALLNLGSALDASGAPDEALVPLTEAVRIAPDLAAAHHALGNALAALGRHADASVHWLRALTIDPGFALAYQNLGCARYELGEYDAAASALDDALALQPDLAIARYNRALIDLQRGALDRGWVGYEARHAVWRTERIDRPLWLGAGASAALDAWRAAQPKTQSAAQSGAQPGAQPAAQPDTLEPRIIAQARGQTLLLHAEQGFGDTLQFIRFVPLAVRQAAHTIVEVQPALLPLLGPWLQRCGAHAIAAGTSRPPFDCHCPLPSLPLALGIDTAALQRHTDRYLQPPPNLMRRWHHRLRPGMSVLARMLPHGARPLRIGIAWSGRVRPRGENRAVALQDLTPLFALPGIDWHVLQAEVPAADQSALDACLQRHPNLHHYPGELHDFAETAALVEQLDGVVSIDTAVAHLAGALAKPVWLLTPYAPDWRWGASGATTPWYASVRLFRQPARNAAAWAPVIARIGADLTRWRGTLRRGRPR